MQEPLVGKKVILFPLDESDVEDFIKLHQHDNGVMCRYSLIGMSDEEARRVVMAYLIAGDLMPFTIKTKEGKASRTVGYIYITDLDAHCASISGAIDREFYKGLAKQMSKDRYTFAQDAFNVLIRFCFRELNVNRVECDILKRNRAAISLVNRENMKYEGTLRQSHYRNGKYEDICMFSILKNEVT
jgi:RimJ/RimL family protein N-acetyltransferase